jgi:deoxycytidylate deaminase
MKDGRAYNRIKKLVRASGMTGHDATAFYFAYETAKRSTFGNFPIGCVIVSGGKILGTGANTTKSDPLQKHYNLRYRNFVDVQYSNREHSLHAEMSAMKSISYTVKEKTDWAKAEAYIFRISPGLPYGQGLAAPCCACAHALADLGIRKVKFSTEYGFATSILDERSGLL